MNSRRLIAAAALAAVVILGLGLKCDSVGIPEIFGPSQGYQGAVTVMRFLATASGNVDFVVDWGDEKTDTLTDNSAGDTLSKSHIWTDAGDYKVKAMAMLTEKNDVSSDWSPEFAIEILPNGLPTADFDAPPQAPVDVVTRFTAWGIDPDEDSVSLMIRFGDDESEWSAYVANGEQVTISHTFTQVGETLWVWARARDIHRAPGPWSDSVQLITVEAGGMLWTWVTPNEDEAPPVTAPVIVTTVEGEELAYVGCDDEEVRIYGVDVSTGKRKEDGRGILPDEGYEWFTHPAYNWGMAHILIGKDDGEFYAFKANLSTDWHYPGETSEEKLLAHEWGNMCLVGNSVYIPNLDTIIRGGDTTQFVTKFYKISDGPERPVSPQFTVIGVQEVLGAPVLDKDNNVYFVTDSGNLFKMNRDIQIQWQKRITEKRGVFGPVIGSGGVVFCGDDDGKVYAYDSAGAMKWEKTLPEVTEMYMVVGKQYLFAACDNGYVYALDPATGGEGWNRLVSADGAFDVYPVLAKNGYMYVVNDNTKLFCLVQATGEQLWDIVCTDYLTGGTRIRRAGGIDDPLPSPALTSTGNIIIVSDDALFCVSGYKDGTLDDSPWPKWQHDNYNTGRWPGP